MKTKEDNVFNVTPQNKEFIQSNLDGYEQYALLYSHSISGLIKGVNCYVKITNTKSGKSIYRRAISRAVKAKDVALGGRTQKELGITKGESGEVLITSAAMPMYYLFHSDKYVALTSWSGLIGFLITVIDAIFNIVLNF